MISLLTVRYSVLYKYLGNSMPFENQINLEVKAFFFNFKTDYLPYYKNFSLEVAKDDTVEDILSKIKEQNSFFSYPSENLILKINGLVVEGTELIDTIVSKEGTTLQIDPALSYRSNNGLIMNDSDFMQSFKLLEPYASKGDLEFYQTLYPLHYASETFRFNHEYIGDAILVLASKMIESGSEHKSKILSAISDEFDGIVCCEYENNLFNGKDYTETIANLKAMADSKSTPSVMEKILSMTNRSKKEERLDSIEGRNVAIYGVNSSTELIEESKSAIINSGANFIEFKRSKKLAGQTLIDSYPQMTYRKAGTMLLDALDNGANILVCINSEDLALFQDIIVESEKVMGRDIELTLISLDTLNELTKAVVA
jgi:succinate dehydrogenase/fumarate reductase-like Fe-S protein